MVFMKQMVPAAALGVAMMIGVGLSAPSAQAAYIVTLAQQGSNVVAIGSGTIDTAGLSFTSNGSTLAATIFPSIGVIITGPASVEPLSGYAGFTGPTGFGSFVFTAASSGSGDIVGINNAGHALYVPAGYVSGSALSDSATYDNQTFSSLGVTPGTYEWTWGTGAHADSFTLEIGVTPVPEPSSLPLLGVALAGLVLVRASRRGLDGG